MPSTLRRNTPVLAYNTIKQKTTLPNGTVFGDLNLGTPATVFTEEKVGTSNPDWEYQVSRKISATSAYTRTWYKYQNPFPTFYLKVKQNSSGWIYEYLGMRPPNPFDPILSDIDTDTVDDIAIKKIKGKIASDRGDLAVMSNLLQDVYELRKTVAQPLASLESLLRNVLNMFSRFSRNRMSRSALIQDVGSLWLAWSFGIKPTLSDAAELSESIQKFLDRREHIKHFGASHYDEKFGSIPGSINLTGVTLNYNDAFARRYSCRFTDARLINITSGLNYASLNEHFHLSLGDFVPTAWELLPWSWLIDYVVNVGEVIEDTFQSSSDRSIYVVKNTKDTNIVSREFVPVIKSGFTLLKYQPAPYVAINRGTFTRGAFDTLPRRIFRFHTKYEIENNSVNKILNLLSIGVSRTKAHHFR